MTVAVVPAHGVKQILHLKDPLMLPAAERPGRRVRGDCGANLGLEELATDRGILPFTAGFRER